MQLIPLIPTSSVRSDSMLDMFCRYRYTRNRYHHPPKGPAGPGSAAHGIHMKLRCSMTWRQENRPSIVRAPERRRSRQKPHTGWTRGPRASAALHTTGHAGVSAHEALFGWPCAGGAVSACRARVDAETRGGNFTSCKKNYISQSCLLPCA